MGWLRTLLRRLLRPGGTPLLEIGSRAPDFAVQDHLARSVRLSDHAGRRVVLWFYPKAATPG